VKKITIPLVLLAAFCLPMLSHAATPIPCSTYSAYQDQVAKMVMHKDYVEAVSDFSASGGDILNMTTEEMAYYGAALHDLSRDMKAMKHIDPKVKAYHVATYTLFGTLGEYLTDASTMGIVPAAMVYQEEMTKATDAFERENAKLPTSCGTSA